MEQTKNEVLQYNGNTLQWLSHKPLLKGLWNGKEVNQKYLIKSILLCYPLEGDPFLVFVYKCKLNIETGKFFYDFVCEDKEHHDSFSYGTEEEFLHWCLDSVSEERLNAFLKRIEQLENKIVY